jgi:hypothetical protein
MSCIVEVLTEDDVIAVANGTADANQQRRVTDAAQEDPRVAQLLELLQNTPQAGATDLAQSR